MIMIPYLGMLLVSYVLAVYISRLLLREGWWYSYRSLDNLTRRWISSCCFCEYVYIRSWFIVRLKNESMSQWMNGWMDGWIVSYNGWNGMRCEIWDVRYGYKIDMNINITTYKMNVKIKDWKKKKGKYIIRG